MFCPQCGEFVKLSSANYCITCGKELVENNKDPSSGASSRSDDVSGATASVSSKPKGVFGRVHTYKEYHDLNKTKRSSCVNRNGKRAKKEVKEEEKDVVIYIGLMEWIAESGMLKSKRGKRLALRVSNKAPYKVLLEKATEKWKAYNSNLYFEDEEYVLLLESGIQAIFMPGSSKDFCGLDRYQHETGKDYKRITLYLCTTKDFHHKEQLDVDSSDNSSDDQVETEDKDKGFVSHIVPTECLRNDDRGLEAKSCTSTVTSNEIEMQIRCDEEMALQMMHKSPTHGSQANSDNETIDNPEAVMQALEKKVTQEKQFFLTVRRGTPLSRILSMWRHESKKTDPHHVLRVHFLGEAGIDTGALAREFLTEVVNTIGNTLFPDGTPIDSTYHVQNGNFRTSGEIVVKSMAEGGPPPIFLDEFAFETLVNCDIDVLNINHQQALTSCEKQLLDKIKNNISEHTDTILEHGYTGPIDESHADDILRSVVVSLVNKRILYLKEFKEGLRLYGFSEILSKNPQACRPLFLRNQQVKVDAAYLFSLMAPEFSPEQSSRIHLEETLMDNFQDFLMALEDNIITGYASAMAWNYSEDTEEEAKETDKVDMSQLQSDVPAEKFETPDLSPAGILGWLTGQKHRQINGKNIKIVVKFDHDCLTRNRHHSLCFPVVGACGRQITFPLSHTNSYEEFKHVFLVAFCKGQSFAKP